MDKYVKAALIFALLIFTWSILTVIDVFANPIFASLWLLPYNGAHLAGYIGLALSSFALLVYLAVFKQKKTQ